MASSVQVLAEHGTGAVSDALDLLGHGGTGLAGLRRVSGSGSVAGPAYTLRYAPVEAGRSAPAGDFVDDVPEGAVVLIANGGRTHCTVWGDILSSVALRRGVAGTVIDGACRDVGESRALGYSLWSLAAYMKSGKHRVRLEAVQVGVVVAGTPVSPGDIVVADDSGALVVPATVLERTAETVLEVARVERLIRADLEDGVPLRETRARHGYNALGLAGR
ncbi:RraA family protein [Kitasatospora sp. NPDC093806]|uniref:RraA family protein n=1 Tax=Kitasatospora sp. NPDC093806 TaxID=3155075 RepID=UPI00343C4BF4